MPKRIEITNVAGKQVQVVWRRAWGKVDRYLIMSPGEAMLFSRQLAHTAGAAESGEPECTVVSEFYSDANA
jgi:hypothetical protein